MLGIIINSLYTNKDIFLREVISNGSDALDKIRFMALTKPDLLGTTPQLEIRISADKETNTLSIRDTGIGMTQNDLIQNLGTIAKSGTKAFVERATESSSPDLSLIGQFGVGFYSVFLVADKVTVTSKHNDDKQYIWESTADNSFSIREDTEGEPLGRGTRVSLYLKDDAADYLKEDKLRTLVQRYSEFIHFPIYLQVTKEIEKPAPQDKEEEEKEKEEEEEKKPETTTEGEEKPAGEEPEVVEEESSTAEEKKDEKPKMIKEKVLEWEQVNVVRPIWMRSPRNITSDEYNAFYKSLSKESDEPLAHVHFTAEGGARFTSVLFVPGRLPSNSWDIDKEKATSIKLYVKRVFITDNFDDLMPRYLSFIRGIVDSEDFPLNVSRELLQQSRIMTMIQKKLVSKALEMFLDLSDQAKPKKKQENPKSDAEKDEDTAEKPAETTAEEPEMDPEAKAAEEARLKKAVERYDTFWKEFGKNIRLGVIEDHKHAKKLAKLLRYQTTKSNGSFSSLEDYVSRMKPSQKHIYFVTGETVESVEKSPFLERLREKDLEVLYMVDAIDEYMVQRMPDYNGKKFVSVSREGLKFGDADDEKDSDDAVKEEFTPLIKWLKRQLGDKIEKAQLSKVLSTTPCILTSPQYGLSSNMERILKAQTLGSESGQAKNIRAHRILEINPHHPIIKDLLRRIERNDEDQAAIDSAALLYDTAVLQSGFSIEDSKTFADHIHNIMRLGLGVGSSAQEEKQTEAQEEQEQEQEDTTTKASESETTRAEEPEPASGHHDEL